MSTFDKWTSTFDNNLKYPQKVFTCSRSHAVGGSPAWSGGRRSPSEASSRALYAQSPY